MSRYYELMQGMAKEQPLLGSSVVQPAFPVPLDGRKRAPVPQLSAGLMQGLVHKVFLEREPKRMVIFAAVDQGNGCSQIAALTAQCLAATAPGAVCLVDANFRSPSLPSMLGATNYHGLTNALSEPEAIRSFLKPVFNESVWLLSTGATAPDSPSLLGSEQMRARIRELREQFAFVLVDVPPLTRHSDAISLAKLSDGVVIVLEAESTRREAARAAVADLRRSGIPILGAVLNKRTYPIPDPIYHWL
jgi:capsular exopolysaccharide synthesis family protein